MYIDYDEYMNSVEWQTKRDQVIARCGGVCENCEINNVDHIHHLTYERFGNEFLDDLRGLCLDCHQIQHPHKKLKRNWMLISDIANAMNITMPSLNRVLKREGLVEKIVISTGYKRNKPHTNTANVPTSKAYDKKMFKNKPGAKHKGQRGPFVWDFDLVKQALESHQIPCKHKNIVELPEFMKKPTKTEEYNDIIGKYGLTTCYYKKTSCWNISRGSKIVAVFYPKFGGYIEIVGKTPLTKIEDGFSGVVRFLEEHKIIDNINDGDTELADFAEKIAARELDEHIRNKVQNEQSNIE